jgi:hypothetical protein
MPAEVIYFSQKRNAGNPDCIEAVEIFDMMMLNFENPKRDSIIIKFINSSKRILSEVTIGLLERRGFSADDIPKMQISSYGRSQHAEYA